MKLFSCAGGAIVLPERGELLVSREDGGDLVVTPSRPVWDRTELTPAELTRWSFLVNATARGMFDALPQLDEGCINYWDAGNWVLNDEAEPRGRKSGSRHRTLRLHLLGRSPNAKNDAWKWGEAPAFPRFATRAAWAAAFERFTPGECRAIVARAEELLIAEFGYSQAEIDPWTTCSRCDYPTTGDAALCSECAVAEVSV